MSMKRNTGTRGSSLGAGEGPGKLERQQLFDDLKKRSETGAVFTPVDVALSVGASEPQVARALIGLGAEGVLERVDVGRYKATPMVDIDLGDFIKVFARASKMDSTRMRDISEIERLKKNNDVMRGRLLRAQAERDHYLAALQKNGIDPGPVPVSEALLLAETRADAADKPGGSAAAASGEA